MEVKDIERYKDELEQERAMLLREISAFAVPNPAVKGDWIPGDRESFSNKREGLQKESVQEQKNFAATHDLEIRLSNVTRALKKIKDGNGTFGICELSGNPIEKERLDSNPAARTCIAHKENDLSTIT